MEKCQCETFAVEYWHKHKGEMYYKLSLIYYFCIKCKCFLFKCLKLIFMTKFKYWTLDICFWFSIDLIFITQILNSRFCFLNKLVVGENKSVNVQNLHCFVGFSSQIIQLRIRYWQMPLYNFGVCRSC